MSAENPAKAYAAAASALPSPGEADFEAICAAVLATERGRWFLSEYARRNCQADTAELLAAIERIAARSGADAAALAQMPTIGGSHERLRAELMEMAGIIARARAELASAMSGPDASGVTLEAAVGPNDAALPDLLAAAEQIQELAWTMREQGFDSQFSDRLDHCAAICLAASRQDRGIERVRKIRHMMRHLQRRIETLVGTLGTAAQAAASEAQTAGAGEETQGRDDLLQQGTALLTGTGAQTNDAPAQAAQIQPVAVADGRESDSQGAPRELGAVVIRPSREKVETGDSGDRQASTEHAESVTAELPPMRVPRGATTLTIEGPKGSFSIMPARAAEPPDPVPPSAPPPEVESTAADVQALAWELAAEGADSPPAAQSPAAQPPAMPVVAETNDISLAAATAADDDIFREVERDLPVAAPQLGDAPQQPVKAAASARASTDIAEYLFADVMALSAEERLALFT